MRRTVLLFLGAALIPIAARAQFPAEVAGQVVDSASGKAIAGARIEIPALGISALSDVSGRYQLRGIKPGVWDLRVGAIGYRLVTRSVEATDGHIERLNVGLPAEAVSLAPVRVEAAAPAMDAGTTVIDAAEIQRSISPSLPALLSGQSGLAVVQRGGPGAPATVSIRGSAAHEVLVLLDGVPLNDPTTGVADLSSIPVEQIERVTIVRGAAAARYGPRALAGAILIERRRPGESEASLALSHGQWADRSARGSLTAAHRGGARTVAGTMGFTFADANGDFRYDQPALRGGGTAQRLNADARSVALAASTRLEAGGLRAEIRGDLLRLRRGLPGSIVQPSLQARESDRRDGAGLSVAHHGASTVITADLQALTETARYWDPHPPTSGPYDDSVRVRQIQGGISAEHHAGIVRASGGAELRRVTLRTSLLTAGAPVSQDFLGAWIQSGASRKLGRGSLELSAGVRADHESRLGGTNVSPTVSLRAPIPGAQVQVTWGMAYAPPGLADQFFQPGVLARPNPDLQPERVRSDLRIQLTSQPLSLGRARASGSLSFFDADIDGMIIWFPDFRFIWSPGNYDVNRTGTEVAAELALPLAGLTVAGSVSSVAVRYTGAVLAGQVAYRPQATANASVSATLAGLRASARYRYVGSRRTVPSSPLNSLDPFGTIDLQVARRLAWSRVSLELTASLDDVTNGAGAMLIDYPSTGRTWHLTASLRAGRPSRDNP